MIQLKTLPASRLVRCAYLVAPESRRQAFYTIWIERSDTGYRVCKESGGLGKVYQRLAWELDGLEEAEKEFNRRVREKTNPSRPSKRKYRLVHGYEKQTAEKA